MIDQKAILAAAERIAPYIHHTPILSSSYLNDLLQCKLLFKCENFQKTGSFKARGAINSILKLKEEDRPKGVVTHSSGNHGQAMAWAAGQMGIRAYVVMPSNAPEIKKQAVQAYGAEVVECAPNLTAREEGMQAIQEKTGAIFIPPYDAFNTIEGQATVALEVYRENIETDLIICPVGGGGLLAGSALSSRYFSPHTKVLGAEPAGADDAWQSLQSGVIVPSENPQTMADGLRTSLGTLNFPIIRETVSDILLCEENSIRTAMKLIWERMKIVVEPSSAVPLACLLEHREVARHKKVVMIISGGNVDLNGFSF